MRIKPLFIIILFSFVTTLYHIFINRGVANITSQLVCLVCSVALVSWIAGLIGRDPIGNAFLWLIVIFQIVGFVLSVTGLVAEYLPKPSS